MFVIPRPFLPYVLQPTNCSPSYVINVLQDIVGYEGEFVAATPARSPSQTPNLFLTFFPFAWRLLVRPLHNYLMAPLANLFVSDRLVDKAHGSDIEGEVVITVSTAPLPCAMQQSEPKALAQCRLLWDCPPL